MNDAAAPKKERSAVKASIADVENPARCMSDAELTDTIARLEQELRAIPTPQEAERLRDQKTKEIHHHEKEQQRRAKMMLGSLSDSEVERHIHGNGWMRQFAYAERSHRAKKLIKKMSDAEVEKLSRSDGDLEMKVLAYEEHLRRKQRG
jgi:pyruvate dehydrogenase complex dehydrogenase (E1) component